jgi:hypothetical protein
MNCISRRFSYAPVAGLADDSTLKRRSTDLASSLKQLEELHGSEDKIPGIIHCLGDALQKRWGG